jgi:hypothetical protein
MDGNIRQRVQLVNKRPRGSVNLALGLVRHVLNGVASEWVDEHGLTWLASPPKIKLLKTSDGRKPYPLSPDEQAKLWEWELEVPELETSVFVIPGDRVKNGADRLRGAEQHYSAAELSNLIEAAEKACQVGSRKSPAVVALKQKAAGEAISNRLMSTEESGAPGRI